MMLNAYSKHFDFDGNTQQIGGNAGLGLSSLKQPFGGNRWNYTNASGGSIDLLIATFSCTSSSIFFLSHFLKKNPCDHAKQGLYI
jgi:hypothetical protein